jgi:phosphatidylglycerophosphate synthase
MILSTQAKQLTDWWRDHLTNWCKPTIDYLKLPEHRDKWYSKHSPNLVTFVRGMISFLVLWGLFYNMYNYPIRVGLTTLLAAIFSFDGVDGMLATELDRKTLLGRIMDPAFDILTLIASGVFVYKLGWNDPSTLQGNVAVLTVLMMIISTLMIWIIAPGRYREGKRLNRDVDSLPLGKVKLVYPLAFGMMIAYLPSTTYMTPWLCYVTLIPASILSMLAAFEYQKDYLEMLKTKTP